MTADGEESEVFRFHLLMSGFVAGKSTEESLDPEEVVGSTVDRESIDIEKCESAPGAEPTRFASPDELDRAESLRLEDSGELDYSINDSGGVIFTVRGTVVVRVPPGYEHSIDDVDSDVLRQLLPQRLAVRDLTDPWVGVAEWA